MKATGLLLLLCLFAGVAQAQVSLVHAFDGFTTTVHTQLYGTKVAVPGPGGTVVLYNTDGSRFRIMHMPAQGGGIFLSDYPSSAISDQLFDDDNGIEGLGWVISGGSRVPAIIEENGTFTLLPVPTGSKRDFLNVKLFGSGAQAYALVSMDSTVAGGPDTSAFSSYKTYLYALPGALPTAIQAHTGLELKAWPVPASGQLAVSLPHPAQPGEALHLFDVNGRAIRRIDLTTGASNLEVDASSLAPGVYTLRGPGYETNLVVQH